MVYITALVTLSALQIVDVHLKVDLDSYRNTKISYFYEMKISNFKFLSEIITIDYLL